jgi:hypothetical protein
VSAHFFRRHREATSFPIKDAASLQSLTRELQSASTLPIKPVNLDLNKGAGAQAFNGMLG